MCGVTRSVTPATPVQRFTSAHTASRDSRFPRRPTNTAGVGRAAVHTARATFAANLFAAGGVDTVAAGPTSNPDEVLAAYDGQAVVCLAGADKTYADWGAKLAKKLREAGARYVVLAGKPGDKTVKPELVDDHCAMGVDALAFLGRVREELTR